MNKGSLTPDQPKPRTPQTRITKNVNAYQHFLKKPGVNEEQIIWATNLRSISLSNNPKRLMESVP